MKKSIILLVCLFVTILSNAQETSKVLDKAENALSNMDLSKAIKGFKEEISNNPSNTNAYEGLVKAYMLNGEKNEALNTMIQLYSTGQMSNGMKLNYAQSLVSQKRFDEAANIYTEIKGSSNGTISSAYNNINNSYFTNLASPNSGYKIRNLSEINSVYSDFSPMIYKNGKLLFISTSNNRTKTGWSTEGIKNQYTDVFVAEKEKLELPIFKGSSSTFLKIDNQKYMQGPVSFANSYGVMYMTRSTMQDNKAVKSTEDKRTVNLEICKVNYSENDLENWNSVTPIQLNRAVDYENYSYAHPALNSTGTTMYFASNMPGGQGGTDLWKVDLVGTEWGLPVNLGPEINTAGEELFPFLSSDNTTLYYASNGLPGLGGLDVFSSTIGKSNSYSTPTNLGSPINSESDDFGFIIDKDEKEGYFSSNRMVNGRNMEDDIYTWRSDEEKIVVKVIESATKDPIAGASINIPCLKEKSYTTDKMGQVILSVSCLKDCEINGYADGFVKNTLNVREICGKKIIELPLNKDYNPKLKMIVYVFDKETKQLIPNVNVNIKQMSSGSSAKGMTSELGKLVAGGIEAGDSYEVSGSKDLGNGERYLTSSESASTRGMVAPDSFIVKLYLLKGKVGKTVKIDNIYYDVNKWNIKPSAAQELNNTVSLLYQNPTMRIEMGSHTDCRASASYNENLSQKRAASAMEYIITRGISRDRLESKGYGESQLVNNCACEGSQVSSCTDEQHQENRRTEFKILSF